MLLNNSAGARELRAGNPPEATSAATSEDAQAALDGIIDCHVHVVGPRDRFPQEQERYYTAGIATTEDLVKSASAAGVRRFVVVQPSFYGADNRATLDAVATLGADGCAVAVIASATITDGTLRTLQAQGVRGLRTNLNSALRGDGRRLSDEIASQGNIARQMNWHLQLVVPFGSLVQNIDLIAGVPVPVVIDHFGLPIGETPDSDAGRAFLKLVSLPHVWVKLSAPYRVLPDPLGTAPPRDWMAALLQTAPDRCVWGSDWPHTPPREEQRARDQVLPYRAISYAKLLGDFSAALQKDIASRVLRSNPERLYGFAPYAEIV
jgi:predicted TIM-barrel fold metal-dependent hydrolase